MEYRDGLLLATGSSFSTNLSGLGVFLIIFWSGPRHPVYWIDLFSPLEDGRFKGWERILRRKLILAPMQSDKNNHIVATIDCALMCLNLSQKSRK